MSYNTTQILEFSSEFIDQILADINSRAVVSVFRIQQLLTGGPGSVVQPSQVLRPWNKFD